MFKGRHPVGEDPAPGQHDAGRHPDGDARAVRGPEQHLRRHPESQGPPGPWRLPAAPLLAAAVGRRPALGELGAGVQPRRVGNRRLSGVSPSKVQAVHRNFYGRRRRGRREDGRLRPQRAFLSAEA